MAKFTRLIETSNPDAPRYVANIGKYIIAETLQEAGLEVKTTPYHPVLEFVSKEGVRFKVTVEEIGPKPGEEEEIDDENSDKAAAAIKMADKATDDDPQTIQSKRNLGAQVSRTYSKLDRGLREATNKLKIQ